MLRKLITVAGGALLAAGLAAAPALAATAHTTAPASVALPANVNCNTGWGLLKDDDGYGYLTGEGTDNALKTTTDNNYCWSVPADNTTGTVQNESDGCAGYNATTGQVDLQTCSSKSVSWQQWTLTESGGYLYLCNQYVSSDCDMSGVGAGDAVYLGGPGPGTAWMYYGP